MTGIYSFSSAKDRTQGLVHAGQAFYLELHPQPLVFDIWSDYIGQVGLKGEILLYIL